MLNSRRTKFCKKVNHLVNILSFCLLLKSFQHVNGVSKSNYNSIHEKSEKDESNEKDELGNYTFLKHIESSV